jgi:hypothetical protein
MKNPNDSIGNQTRDPPACSAVPQLITLTHVSYHLSGLYNFEVVPRFLEYLCTTALSGIRIQDSRYQYRQT